MEYIKVLNKAAVLNYNLQNFHYVLSYLEITHEMDNKYTLYNLATILHNIGEYKKSLEYLECIENNNDDILNFKQIITKKPYSNS